MVTTFAARPGRVDVVATDPAFVEHLIDQLAEVPDLSARRMFGEYALYVGPRVVALACDNQLFVKPTAAGRALLGAPVEAAPYPGAKPCFLIDQLDDAAFLAALVGATASELPLPKQKKKKPKPKTWTPSE